MLLLGVTSFSYAGKFGSDSYEIYLNKKLIMKQYVTSLTSTLMNLPMDNVKPTDQLVIYYSHCGTTGQGRSIVIRNEENKLLKEWKFADAKGSDRSITIQVQEIIDLKKSNPRSTLNMYYSSKQLPEGRMLASIHVQSKTTTRLESKSEAASLVMVGIMPFIF
jgi:hypothetical protein